MDHPSVAIGMSGGVDSSAAALLLKKQGFDCTGMTMQLWEQTDSRDARAICDQLQIPHQVLDCREAFRSQVIDDFVKSYESGSTPNPCIVCNRTMKFGLMLEKALALGFDYVATGHYARIRRNEETGRYQLLRAGDCAKDQTYFLCCLTQDQLSHTLFPLGSLTKEEIRNIAENSGLITARKRDSQDICFVPDGDYVSFLKRYTGKDYPQGSYLDEAGQVLGTHRGAVCYTIGQRRGLGIALGAPAYVCGKDMAANTVTLGPNASLMHRTLVTDSFNWIEPPRGMEPVACTAKVRHTQFDQPAVACPLPDGSVKVIFETPQRAITPGQTVALYQGQTVLGGGPIREVIPD